MGSFSVVLVETDCCRPDYLCKFGACFHAICRCPQTSPVPTCVCPLRPCAPLPLFSFSILPPPFQADVESEGVILEGDPREQILHFCEGLKPEALIVASHGKGVIGK